ncbi:MAG: aminodeoxychorismate/anthranilate synthase component II [Hyphomicrobiaceae bacterium]|nr:aminodeoxychorismate/anthranilate synthase component II [Hyphomicrobiaceae bacterium]
MFLLIDNYDSFTYNLVQIFGELGVICNVTRNDKITVKEALAQTIQAIIISPGPRTPNEAGICLKLIEEASGLIPILGVCLGHQAIGQAYGGVIQQVTPMHGKISKISCTNKGIFKGLPSSFSVARYHSLSLNKERLSKDLEITAVTADGVLMGIQHKKYPVFGVQFHPESIASEHGYDLLANFLKIAGVKSYRRQKNYSNNI